MKIIEYLYRIKRVIIKWYEYHLPDKIYLKIKFKQKMAKDLDLKNPKTFNEKINWLKLYNRRPEYTTMVDKYAVREYIKSKCGNDLKLIPLIGVWNRVEDIDFDSLPNQFVLKCNHDYASVIICKDKTTFDVEGAKRKLDYCMHRSMFKPGREWGYKNVDRKIICEKYMTSNKQADLIDYKFFCFDGIVKLFEMDFNRFSNHKTNYYNREAELLDFGEKDIRPDKTIVFSKPAEFEKMIEIAEMLSSGNPFLRVDLYDIDGEIYFGELTLYPDAGYLAFEPEEWDDVLGEYITLPQKYKHLRR